MIRITGDTHGERKRFEVFIESGELEWGEGDYLIVCGDFGYIFLDDIYERKFLDVLEKKPYTICFCDGNHENFPVIYSYPVEEWNGGMIHRIRKNVIHLMRGQIFNIDGKSFFTMGGGYSRDKAMRWEGYSWWKEEMPTNEEYNLAIENLKSHDMKVDYIITHTAPRKAVYMLERYPDIHEMELTGFLDWVLHEVDFKKWFFGHWHTDEELTEKLRAVYFDVIDIE